MCGSAPLRGAAFEPVTALATPIVRTIIKPAVTAIAIIAVIVVIPVAVIPVVAAKAAVAAVEVARFAERVIAVREMRREDAVDRPAMTIVEHERYAALAIAAVGVLVGQAGLEIIRAFLEAVKHPVSTIECDCASIFADRNFLAAAEIVAPEILS